MGRNLKALRLAAVLLTLSGASGCDYYDSKVDSQVLGQLSYIPGYTTVRAQVLEKSCFECHKPGKKSPDLTTFESARMSAKAINRTVVIRRTMPKDAELTPEQLRLVKAWIDGGTPEEDVRNAPRVPSPSPTPSLTPDEAILQIRKKFASQVRPLIKNACMDCHDSHAKPKGFLGALPIARQIEWNHIHKGSAALDFSRAFPTWSDRSSSPVFYFSQIKKVIENSSMPPAEFKVFHESDGKLLTFAEEQVIIDWIDWSSALWASANPAPLTASRFFGDRCLGCHNSVDHSGGFVFRQEGDQVLVPVGKTDSGIPFLDPGNPENSAVYLVLLTDPTQRRGLSQMPDEETATDLERALILNWIKQPGSQ